MSDALSDLPEIRVGESRARMISNGREVGLAQTEGSPEGLGDRTIAKATTLDGLLAIGRIHQSTGERRGSGLRFKPARVFREGRRQLPD